MRYVAAYLLASLSGKEPSNDEIEKILSSVGIESDTAKASLVLKELKGKNVDEVIESGRSKLASVPTGAAVATSAGAGGAAPAASEEKGKIIFLLVVLSYSFSLNFIFADKKEEKKEESDNESDDDMGFGLFN
ncbi:60S acidic ribosomal protein P2-like isoform X1 [Melanaphis sacchari]|uniref:60S acidic ribosomal protein P2-like isoform X1 n=1 Tax=Melanaphis sacchari TaxID=742174 RepID=UPI000DC138F9|nr:60S acidic ribosomal protein P2-like isoform X1 [Melanaphis sacchari]XP_025204521.1 60S acidic ribosomal protein P2-like isoform X1 [Melanaphis sacchari]